ncbi:hypothetical protein ALC57_04300 [Trachymyrmex cornetzi]|uniref:Uncharacterized protein n=1 Tax=Trachymyrmex cornetzi TaxID=471704 RepID=A0A195EE93_9HYME|nr:hypothetical protein ALC57_04300 [Trachymyrmex cornetzi]
MEMRNVVEVVRRWCHEKVWYVRKGLPKIMTADKTNPSPVSLLIRPKCNFIIEPMLITYRGLLLTY